MPIDASRLASPAHPQVQAPSRPDAGRPRAAGSLTEFFRYHGFWAPGVRLFRCIGFRAKASLIATTFLVPMAVLMWNYFSSQAAQIEFSAKERLGLAYAREVMPLLNLQQRQRLMAVQAAVPGGRPGDAAAAESLVAALKAQRQRLAEVQKRLGDELGTAKAYAAWEQSLQQAGAAGGSADAVFSAHSAGVQALIDLLGVATDGSNLTLDPDIDTYYLMDAAMFRLPVMVEAVAQLRGLGAAALGGGALTPLQARRVVEQLTLLASNESALAAGIDKAVAYNAEVRAALSSEDAKAPGAKVAALVEATLLRPEGLQGDAAAHVADTTQAIERMFELADRAGTRLDALVAARVQRLEFGRNLTAAVLALGLLAGLYTFVAFGKVLAGGLREMAFHIDAMRDGNLTTQPRPWGTDEAAALMITLAQMQLSLRQIVQRVRGAGDNIVAASSEISKGAEDLHARTEQSAANLEETASAMEQIAATVRSNESAVQEATKLAAANAQAAERGGQVIGQVEHTMQQINASASRIGDIVGTIEGIAFQTNLLALNAAVEAARAGDQGRGFAVVAAEVRALAQRSATAAKEIKGLVGDSNRQVEGGVRVVREAGQAIGEIVGAAQRVRSLLADVAVGAQEQSAGIGQSAKAVQELDSVTQQNAALVEQTASAASSLLDQARDRAGEVSRFTLPA